jgi:membrane protease YdiL (CAAX protease family)
MREPRPISLWATAGFGLLVLVVTAITQNIAMLGVGVATGRIDLAHLDPNARADALLFSAGIILSSIAGGAVLYLVIRVRSPRAYLALVRPRMIALWIGAEVAFNAVASTLRWLTTGHVVPLEWVEAMRNAPVALVLVALAVFAPLFEESFFRGFLHRGLAASRLRVPGAIIVTSLLFTLAHFPADTFALFETLLGALLLASARHHSRSLITPIVMHAIGNASFVILLATSR